MAPVRVVFYKEIDGTVPMLEWLEDLRTQPKHRAKVIKWLTFLREHGHDLRRPKADFLREGIYELRVRFGFGNYRMLYFFDGRSLAIVTHGLTKHSDKVPTEEIDNALAMKTAYEGDPGAHSFRWEGI